MKKETIQALLEKGISQQKEGKLSAAKTSYEKILKRYPKHAEVTYLLGILAYQEARPEEAIRLIEQAIALDSNVPEFYVNLGAILHNQGESKQASKPLEKALEIDPNCKEAANHLGKLYQELGKLDQAERIFKKLVRKNPNNAEFYNNLGFVLFKQKKIGAAIKAYRKALQLFPEYVVARINLSIALIEEEGKLDEAHRQCLKAIAFDNKLPLAYHTLGLIHEAKRQFEGAIQAYEEAIALDSEFSKAYINTIQLLIKQNDYEKALVLCEKTIHLFPKLETAHLQLATIQAFQKKYKAAIDTVLNFVKKNRASKESYKMLACLYLLTNQQEEAKKTLEKLIGIAPKEIEGYFMLGILFQQEDNPQQALYYYKKAKTLKYKQAEYMINELSGKSMKHLPAKEVAELFDKYAESFEGSLVDTLSYHVPEQLLELLLEESHVPKLFNNVLDMGCGTGLCGKVFRSVSLRLQGVDLSPKMIEKAKAKKIYNVLEVADITEFLDSTKEKFDLVIAADVFIYIGELDVLFSRLCQVMKAQAYLLFSVESTDQKDYTLTPTGRYAHSPAYIKKLAAKHHLQITKHKKFNLRKERLEWVKGELYLLSSSRAIF